ncbi:hypothetical protein ETAA8_62900 [Anatilimnocola aggregata]|uniref:Zinc ribbon domain-containing protein n=1 Tax=Anatilimnocola aggregata TaxID=2528021 RepID=A0A517YLM2_9BACT|nr:hypothetical protein [Anatilimnocola aggregata]QDU31137.1 hypothetical protein ETAA8_62900 [Anatilimnocola aggregata]
MTTREAHPQGPWSHRFLLGLFNVVLGVLIFWLLGFVLADIGSWPGPDYEALELRLLDQVAVSQYQSLEAQTKTVEAKIVDQNAQRQFLRDSTENSQRTMTQLLEFQKLNLQRDVKPSAEEQKVLAESEQLFLANQQQYQKHNEELVKLDVQLRSIAAEREVLANKLETLRVPIRAEYERQLYRHNLRVGAVKLAFLLPVLLSTVGLYIWLRRSQFVRLIYAFGAAVFVRVGLVMHEYFPARYFKYILIVTALVVVLWILIYLLRMIARPSRDWLFRQYREAYEAFLCPVCSYPIRRGPLRYLSWTRRSIRNLILSPVTAMAAEEAYVCPACSTQLYEKCEPCGAIRPSLLPACPNCGRGKTAEAPTS